VRGLARPRDARLRCAPARRGERRTLALPPRSLLVLRGEARLAWHHYIPHRKTDPAPGGSREPRAARRVSLTFRQARARALRSGAMTEPRPGVMSYARPQACAQLDTHE